MQKFILPAGRTSLLRFIDRLSDSSKSWEVTIKPFVRRRSSTQNNLLWGVVYAQAAVFFGVTKDEIHEGMGDLYLPKKRNKVTGKEHAVSTTSLSTKEFGEYVEKVCAFWATEHGLHIEIGEPK